MPSNKGRLATTLPDGSIQWQAWGYAELLDHIRADVQLDASTDLLPGSLSLALGGYEFQPGDLIESFGTSRAGALFCDGSTITGGVAAYPALAAAVPGLISGSNLILPDIRGRNLICAGTGSGLSARTLRTTGGEENHALLAAESGVNGNGSTGTGTSGTDSPDHAHGAAVAFGIFGTAWSDDGGANNIQGGATTRMGRVTGSVSVGGATARHAHSVPSLALSARNADSSHNNMQPFVVVNIFIKT